MIILFFTKYEFLWQHRPKRSTLPQAVLNRYVEGKMCSTSTHKDDIKTERESVFLVLATLLKNSSFSNLENIKCCHVQNPYKQICYENITLSICKPKMVLLCGIADFLIKCCTLM